MMVDAAYRIGDFARARTALERLAADATARRIACARWTCARASTGPRRGRRPGRRGDTP
jgi:hypothetical protein